MPVATSKVVENNTIDLTGATRVRSIGNVVLLTEPGIGVGKRAIGAGMAIIPVPVPVPLPSITYTTEENNNRVNVGQMATIEAGINYRTLVQLLPYEVNNETQLSADKVGKDLTTAEKTALGLDEGQQYHYAALDLKDVALSISAGSIVELVGSAYGKGVSGKSYRFAPPGGAAVEENLVLEIEDYTNTKRWQEVKPDHSLSGNEVSLTIKIGETVRTANGRWYQRMGEGVTFNPATATYSDTDGWREIDVTSSDKGQKFAMALSDDFYVVKPKDMALPTLVYANVANQLLEDRAKVVGWMESHAGNAEAIARYQALLTKIDQQLQTMTQEMNLVILDRVKKAVAIVANAKKYNYIIDESTTLFSAGGIDVTNEVIVELLKLEAEAKKTGK